MNILILTGRFGMGHIKCAEALREQMLSSCSDAHVDTVDLIEYLYPRSAQYIYKGFGRLVSGCSGLYNKLNIIAGNNSGTIHKLASCSAYGSGGTPPFGKGLCAKMQALLDRYEPDLVIANLPICAQYFGAYRELKHIATPLYVFVTDITFHSEWIAPATDLYFVGDVSTRNALISHGVDGSRIHITGIPVSSSFSVAAGRYASSCSNAGNPENIRGCVKTARGNVLVMGGGLGMVPGGRKTLEVLASMDDVQVTLVCGSNHKLKRYASSKYPHFNIIGRTDKVPQLMAQAHILITKPGGITTFEAIRSQTPLYIITPTLEQEKGNARFIEGNNIGRVMYDQGAFTSDNLRNFLADDALLSAMRSNMRRLTESMEEQNPLYYYNAEARQNHQHASKAWARG